jgi:hypothetical protein
MPAINPKVMLHTTKERRERETKIPTIKAHADAGKAYE